MKTNWRWQIRSILLLNLLSKNVTSQRVGKESLRNILYPQSYWIYYFFLFFSWEIQCLKKRFTTDSKNILRWNSVDMDLCSFFGILCFSQFEILSYESMKHFFFFGFDTVNVKKLFFAPFMKSETRRKWNWSMYRLGTKPGERKWEWVAGEQAETKEWSITFLKVYRRDQQAGLDEDVTLNTNLK